MSNVGYLISCTDCLFSVRKGNRKVCEKEGSPYYHKFVSFNYGCELGYRTRTINNDGVYWIKKELNGYMFTIQSRNQECAKEICRKIYTSDLYEKEIRNLKKMIIEKDAFIDFVRSELPDVYKKLWKEFRKENKDD